MERLAHIIAVTRCPAEIEEAYVPVAKKAERIALLSKRFDTVFVYREFTGTKPDRWNK